MASNGIRRGLLDLIDGGGIGAEGNEFEGGGLLSAIANALGTPYGSEDRMRDAMQAQRPVSLPSTMQFGSGSVGSAPVYSGRGDVGMPMPASQMPLTQASDIPGGFNPANAAPVQPSSPSYTQPSSMQMPTPQLSQEQIAQKFGDDMVRVYGRDTANSIMSSPSAQGVYLHYINNGYQLPAL